jgi:hypothetical protein
MRHSTAPSIPCYRNPAYRPGLAALVGWLLDHSYSSHAIGRIEAHVATTGTLAGSMIEPEDEAGAEEAFTAALPAVDLDSDAWDRDTGVLFDVAMLAEGNHPWPIVGGPDDDRDFDAAMAALEDLPTANGWTPLPPVSGGAPLDGDRADFESWLDSVDAGYPPADQPGSGWPRVKTADDRRQDRRDVAEFYRQRPA